MALLSLVIAQGDVEHARFIHLAGLYLDLLILGVNDALVLHALDGDVMQVLSALSMGVVGVPAGGYGSKSLDVVLIRAWIEDEPVAERLEECEI